MVWLSGEVTSIYKGMDKGYIIYFIYNYIYIYIYIHALSISISNYKIVTYTAAEFRSNFNTSLI